jgi:diguanylate cyclase (GGDEF)-like protein/PAS domain S-box-containing protein
MLGRALVRLPHPVVIHRDGIILWVNQAAVRLVGADSPDQLIGRQALEFVAPEQRAEASQRIAALHGQQDLADGAAFTITRLDGQRVEVETSAAAMDWAGRPAACMVLWDVTERRRSVRQLRWEATHDALTDLLNRRGVLDELARWEQTRVRSPTGYAVVLADLDRFKAINDTVGHGGGDRVLRDVARQLEQVCAGCLVGRYGGDEFVVAARHVSADETQALVDRIAAINVTLRQVDGLAVSPSVGGAWSPAFDSEPLLQAADRAMYQAKRSRRPTVVTVAATTAGDRRIPDRPPERP